MKHKRSLEVKVKQDIIRRKRVTHIITMGQNTIQKINRKNTKKYMKRVNILIGNYYNKFKILLIFYNEYQEKLQYKNKIVKYSNIYFEFN